MPLLQTLSLQINANKFICDREAKALGLKGPVDFIEGEDGCDKRIEEYMKNKAHIAESSGDKKAFDVCIMNPPYDKNLHLKILEKVIPYAEETINISPIRWLQDPLAKYKKNSDYNKFKESIAEKITSLHFVEDSNKLFNIAWSDLAIIHCDENGGYDYEKLQENWIKDKILEKKDKTFMDVATREAYRGEYKSDIFGIINSHYADTSAWIKDDYKLFKTKRETHTNKVLFFDTEAERRNCFEYLTLMPMRYYAIKVRINQRVPWQFVPYLDYTHPWDNKRFCDYFKITGYISDTEAEPGSEWEEILKTMEKYK